MFRFRHFSRVEQHGPAPAGSEEGCEGDQGMEHLSYEQRLRAGPVHPAEEKASGTPYSGLPMLKGESWEGTFYKEG